MWTEEVKIIFHFVLSVLRRLMTEVSVLSEIINILGNAAMYSYLPEPQAFMQQREREKELKAWHLVLAEEVQTGFPPTYPPSLHVTSPWFLKELRKRCLTFFCLTKIRNIHIYIFLFSNKLNSILAMALRAAEAIFLQRMMFALKSTLLTLFWSLKETRAFHIILLFWHKYIW